MPTTAGRRAAIQTKEAAGYRPRENPRELQLFHCEEFRKARELDIVVHRHGPAGIRRDFEGMMGDATQDEPPFNFIVVHQLRNFSWSLDETVLCRNPPSAGGATLISTMENSP